MEKTQKVFVEKFKGHDVISIWDVDSNGNKIGKYPVISFGTKKAQAILSNVNAITFELLRLVGPKGSSNG